MEVSGKLQPPAALPPYPLNKRLGAPNMMSGLWRRENLFGVIPLCYSVLVKMKQTYHSDTTVFSERHSTVLHAV